MVIVSACLALSTGASAATATTSLDVSVTVVPACTVTATGITFPDYDGSSLVIAYGDVTVNCSLGTEYNIALDAGLYYDGFNRFVSDGANTLLYTLYKPSGGPVWGDSDFANTYPSGASLADTGDGSDQPHEVRGLIASGYYMPSGVYSDTVTVTVHY